MIVEIKALVGGGWMILVPGESREFIRHRSALVLRVCTFLTSGHAVEIAN